MWVLLIGACSWLGFELIPYLRVKCPTPVFRIFLGWLVGASLTGYCLYLTNFIIPLTTAHSVGYLCMECICAAWLRKRSPNKKVEVPKMVPWLLFVMLFISGLSLKYLSAVYRDVPKAVPMVMQPFVDDELSFIHCAMDARRPHPLFYRNPRMSGHFYEGNASPLLFTAMLMKLGASYSDASIVICFMNIISACYCIFLYSARFTIWPWFSTLVVLLNGCSATRLYLFEEDLRMDRMNDFVHRISDQHETMGYQFMFSLMSFSKSTSLSIALAQYAIYTMNGLLVSLIPSFSASFGIFSIMSLCSMRRNIFPWIISLLPKIVPFRLSYWPLFREEMMRGTFCSCVKIWGDVFGFLPMALLIYRLLDLPRTDIHSFLIAGITPLCFLEFIRDGSRYENMAGVVAFLGPTVMVAVACCMRMLRSQELPKVHQGGMYFVMWLAFFYIVTGGVICALRICKSKTECITNTEIVSWITEFVPKKSVLLIEPRLLHPAILAGRQLFLGDKKSIWNSGVNLQQKLYDLDAVVNETTAKEAWKQFGIEFAIEEIGKFEIDFPKQVVRENGVFRLIRI